MGGILDKLDEWLRGLLTLCHILTHKNYKRGNRTLWLVIAIIGMEFIGPILYFLLGKEDD